MESKTEMRSFYPRPHMSEGAIKTTESTTITSGSLTVGNSYFISKSGDDTTSFDGAVTNKYGEFFTATGTNAVFAGAELEDITNGKATEVGFFYGHPATLQFIWKMTYNSDGDCTSITVANEDGSQIDQY